MNCSVYESEKMIKNIPTMGSVIADYFTKPDSEFQQKLRSGAVEGSIAIVCGDEGVVGWARTEPWFDESGGYWDTLEAFISPKLRSKGVATFAATGLRAAGAFYSGAVAVFDPKMLMVARAAGLFPTLFTRKDGGGWDQM